ncbi:hypothetical protein JNUCC32_03250 [Paenibacillus sp. JNUCC32]|uniref:hypothetical protein n=1 Tax=Paenibacillus sp. JNUCC32 TaxID=2777984 RepID=UPI0017886B86|nr:hypothetical protein [Paenibacillus sp. JNUCC-32]QOT11066.1 hypothetical protein JNUCC32_03250 [Paenibacillus sp. JNUCC-32]
MNSMKNYWLKPVSAEASEIHTRYGATQFATRKMITVAFLASLSAIFQSMGGLLPGIGYLISPLATAPIVLCTILSVGSGLTAYLLAMLLVFFIQPSELIVFPFTTGLLGLGIGGSLLYLKLRLPAVIAGSFSLWAGILLLLYVFRFPVLGPAVSSTVSLSTISIVYVFSLFYSWLWVEISRYLITKISKGLLE